MSDTTPPSPDSLLKVVFFCLCAALKVRFPTDKAGLLESVWVVYHILCVTRAPNATDPRLVATTRAQPFDLHATEEFETVAVAHPMS